MKFLLVLTLLIHSVLPAFSLSEGWTNNLKDIFVAYDFEVQSNGNTSVVIDDQFKKLIKDYYISVGSEEFSYELSEFIKTLPNSDEKEQLLHLVDIQGSSPEKTLEMINQGQILEKALAGDSANWTNNTTLATGVFIALIVATIVITAVLASQTTTIYDDAEPKNDSTTTSTNDDGSVTVYKRFTGYRTDTALTEVECVEGNATVNNMLQSAINEVTSECLSDSGIISKGLTGTCDERVFSEVRFRRLNTCDVYAEIRLSYTK